MKFGFGKQNLNEVKEGSMYIEFEKGTVTEIQYFRKSYRKARWRRSAERAVRRTLDDKPLYDGVIVIL